MIDSITEEVTLLEKKKISDISELETCEYLAKERLDELIQQRKCFYSKIRRYCNTETKEMLQQDVAILSKEIKQLRKMMVLYERIRVRSLNIKEVINLLNEILVFFLFINIALFLIYINVKCTK